MSQPRRVLPALAACCALACCGAAAEPVWTGKPLLVDRMPDEPCWITVHVANGRAERGRSATVTGVRVRAGGAAAAMTPNDRAWTLEETGGALFLRLGADGVLLSAVERDSDRPDPKAATAAWTGPAPDLATPGKLAIAIELDLRWSSSTGERVAVDAELVTARPPAGARSAAQLREAALAAATPFLPKPRAGQGRDPGWRPAWQLTTGEAGRRRFGLLAWDGGWMTLRYGVELALDGSVLGITRNQDSGCLAAGTRVATPEGGTTVERLRPGDLLLAIDPADGRPATVTVLAAWPRPAGPQVRLDGSVLAAEHPVWSDGAWRPAGALRPGDPVLGSDGLARILREAAPCDGPAQAWEIAVSGPHCFLAGGMLVHNKSPPAWDAKRQDPWSRLWPQQVEQLAGAGGVPVAR